MVIQYMSFSHLLSLTLSEKTKKSQNKEIAMELAEKISDLLEEFHHDYEEGIPIINESLSRLAQKDKELALEILRNLEIMHPNIDKKYPFSIK